MNGFDLASHYFAVLPMYMSYITKQYNLLAFTAITTIISFIYHLNETKISLLFDEFASCALIIVTFMVYMNQVYKPAYIALGLLLVVVVIEYYVDLDLLDFFVGITVLVAIMIFFYERKTLKETPKRLKMKDAYFISFISTQLIAVAFFIWDKEPYAHSLWHLFAFVSLGSAIAHIHENDEDLKRILFYCLGSIPSRIFIAAIFIHWKTATYPDNIPVAIGTILLGIPMIARPVMWILRGDASVTTLALHGLSYLGIGSLIFLKKDNMLIAGIWLISDTLLSGYVWYRRNKDMVKHLISGKEPKPIVEPKYKKIQLENLRF